MMGRLLLALMILSQILIGQSVGYEDDESDFYDVIRRLLKVHERIDSELAERRSEDPFKNLLFQNRKLFLRMAMTVEKNWQKWDCVRASVPSRNSIFEFIFPPVIAILNAGISRRSNQTDGSEEKREVESGIRR